MFGTEVFPPGCVRADDGSEGIVPTAPESALATKAGHRDAFATPGLACTAQMRAVGLAVQPGLELAPDHVHHFNLKAPDALSPVLAAGSGLAFEAHWTDHQAPAFLRELARRHSAMLKVGSALTHAYRQAIYALDAVAAWIVPDVARNPVADIMETLMLVEPRNWLKH